MLIYDPMNVFELLLKLINVAAVLCMNDLYLPILLGMSLTINWNVLHLDSVNVEELALENGPASCIASSVTILIHFFPDLNKIHFCDPVT